MRRVWLRLLSLPFRMRAMLFQCSACIDSRVLVMQASKNGGVSLASCLFLQWECWQWNRPQAVHKYDQFFSCYISEFRLFITLGRFVLLEICYKEIGLIAVIRRHGFTLLLCFFSLLFYFQICETPACVKLAGEMVAAMNTSVHPCDDFYEVCTALHLGTGRHSVVRV